MRYVFPSVEENALGGKAIIHLNALRWHDLSRWA